MRANKFRKLYFPSSTNQTKQGSEKLDPKIRTVSVRLSVVFHLGWRALNWNCLMNGALFLPAVARIRIIWITLDLIGDRIWPEPRGNNAMSWEGFWHRWFFPAKRRLKLNYFQIMYFMVFSQNHYFFVILWIINAKKNEPLRLIYFQWVIKFDRLLKFEENKIKVFFF